MGNPSAFDGSASLGELVARLAPQMTGSPTAPEELLLGHRQRTQAAHEQAVRAMENFTEEASRSPSVPRGSTATDPFSTPPPTVRSDSPPPLLRRSAARRLHFTPGITQALGERVATVEPSNPAAVGFIVNNALMPPATPIVAPERWLGDMMENDNNDVPLQDYNIEEDHTNFWLGHLMQERLWYEDQVSTAVGSSSSLDSLPSLS